MVWSSGLDNEMVNDNDNAKLEIIKRKAEFYLTMNLLCHVKLIGTGFLNGKFTSGFILDGGYYLFEDIRNLGNPRRLFIEEIFDVEDYEEVNSNAIS